MELFSNGFFPSLGTKRLSYFLCFFFFVTSAGTVCEASSLFGSAKTGRLPVLRTINKGAAVIVFTTTLYCLRAILWDRYNNPIVVKEAAGQQPGNGNQSSWEWELPVVLLLLLLSLSVGVFWLWKKDD